MKSVIHTYFELTNGKPQHLIMLMSTLVMIFVSDNKK